jgi:hypothetical protein
VHGCFDGVRHDDFVRRIGTRYDANEACLVRLKRDEGTRGKEKAENQDQRSLFAVLSILQSPVLQGSTTGMSHLCHTSNDSRSSSLCTSSNLWQVKYFHGVVEQRSRGQMQSSRCTRLAGFQPVVECVWDEGA